MFLEAWGRKCLSTYAGTLRNKFRLHDPIWCISFLFSEYFYSKTLWYNWKMLSITLWNWIWSWKNWFYVFRMPGHHGCPGGFNDISPFGEKIFSICIFRPCYIYITYSGDKYSRLFSILTPYFSRPPSAVPAKQNCHSYDVTSTVEREMVLSNYSPFSWIKFKWICGPKNHKKGIWAYTLAVAPVLKVEST